MSLKLRSISRTACAVTYAPFALIFCLALLLPEASVDLVKYRALYTLYACIALAAPAFVLRITARESRRGQTYWLLFWTFAWLTFGFHLGYSFVLVGGASALPIVIFLWWTLDLAVGWLGDPDAGWTRGPRTLLHLAVLTGFCFHTLVQHGAETTTRVVGWALLVVIAASLLARYARRADPATA